MIGNVRRSLLCVLPLLAAPAWAQEKHQLCTERPGLTISECVIEAGHAQIETGLADWTLDKQAGSRTDTILLGDTLLRVGVGSGVELRLGWTPYGIVRDRDDGEVSHAHRTGDVLVGVKANLIDAGKHGDIGLSLAVAPFATLPAGRTPVGAGDWGAGAEVPIGYRLSKTLKFELTPRVEAAVDEDGSGRHLAYGAAAGAKIDLVEAVSLQVEGQVKRDDDPDPQERGTEALAALSLAVQPNDRTQFDVGGNAGLNRHAPDVELYAGITRWF
jgi:hypothetical protein